MKKYFILWLAVLTVLKGASQITNGSFTQFNTGSSGCTVPTISGTCPTFPTNCVVGWEKGSGTPQILSEVLVPSGTNYYAYMVAQCCDERGESIYTPFTFTKGRVYTLSYNYNFFTNTNYQGRLFAAATKTFTPNNGSAPDCQKSLPSMVKQDIFSLASFGGWGDNQTTFLANDDYVRLLFYASMTFGGEQVGVGIDNVSVYENECDATISINSGQLYTSYGKTGTYIIGSASPSIVTVNPTANTSIVAASLIKLIPNFSASVTSGSFSAKISACPNGSSLLLEDDVKSVSLEKRAQEIIFPMPFQDHFIIKMNVKDRIDKIKVYSNSGQLIRTISATQSQFQKVNMSGMSPGVYFVEFTGKNISFTRKVVKSQ